MRYVISQPQFDHLRREGFLELEDFYTSIQAESLKALLDEEKAKQSSGYELQRSSSPLLKELQCSKLGQLASALFQKKRLRIAFTDFEPSYSEPTPIEGICSLTDVCGSALIHLETGSVTFYKLDFTIDYSKLDSSLLLVAFAGDRAMYKKQESDPHTNYLKKLGYGFGDRITTDTHSLISTI